MGLKDLFDIALTTLAFLSFGMFILQVIMCVTMVKQYMYEQVELLTIYYFGLVQVRKQ